MRHSDEKMILIYVVGLFYVNEDITVARRMCGCVVVVVVSVVL
jgi:hypothetical protein